MAFEIFNVVEGKRFKNYLLRARFQPVFLDTRKVGHRGNDVLS